MNDKSNLDVIRAVTERRSVRRFQNIMVPQETIAAILRAASRAPSGTNIQPWFVHCVSGETRDRLSRTACAAAAAGDIMLEYRYIPEKMREPYLSRKRKIGYDLYELYGVDRDDWDARKAAMLRNFDFFGAPVGLFFTMDRDMELGAWLDCGMFMQNVMISARAYGLETCPQQAWCDLGHVVHRELGVPQHQIILSGMALGYADDSAAENSLVTTRVPVEEFTTWHS